VTLAAEPVDQRRTDHAGRAGDEKAHHVRLGASAGAVGVAGGRGRSPMADGR
jgi:hypothetical protein